MTPDLDTPRYEATALQAVLEVTEKILVRYICTIVIFQGFLTCSQQFSTFCHLSEISAGVFLSQSITYFYRYLITCLGPISDGNRIPNQPNIELTKRKIPPFKLGTSLLTVFIFRTFCFGSQSTLRAHLIRDSYRSKFTKTFTVVDY